MVYKRIPISEVAYISYYDLSQFILANSDELTDDNLWDYMRKHVVGDERMLYCEKNIYMDKSKEKYHDINHWKWMNAFYEAYPEYDMIMFVYDS